MRLTELLDASRVRVPLGSRTKHDLIRELVDLAAPGNGAGDALLSVVLEREADMSTGIGEGVAVPHGRSPHVDRLIMAAGVTGAPVDFDALDGEPVRLVFLLLGPAGNADLHIRALSRIARLARRADLRQRLLAAPDGPAFLATLADADA